MRAIAVFKLDKKLCLVVACCLLSVSAMPTFGQNSAQPNYQQTIAYSWETYLNTQKYNQLPSWSTARGNRLGVLPQQFKAFRERISHLEELRRWVLSNHEANKALTEQQRATLTMPFFAWDPQSLRLERGDYPGMAERLERESSFIAQVETVLNDVVKHLPDLSRPM